MKNGEKFAELELLLSISDGERQTLEYIRENPAIADDYVRLKSLEIQICLARVQKVSLHMAYLLSKN